MDDLFGNCSRKGNNDAAIANNCNEDIGLEYVEDQLYFESASDMDNAQSPHKSHNNLSRFQDNIMTYVSPMTKQLHKDIAENSPSWICHHSAESIWESRKNIISIIDYIISNSEIEEDPQSAIMFDQMEKSLQKFKLELQQWKILLPKTPPRKGMIEFPAFNGQKKKTEPRVKGCGG